MLKDILGFDSWHLERPLYDPHKEADAFIAATEEEREETRSLYLAKSRAQTTYALSLPRIHRVVSRYKMRRDIDTEIPDIAVRLMLQCGFSNRAIEKSTGIGRNRIARFRKELDL